MKFIPSGGFFVIILFVLSFPFYLNKSKNDGSPLRTVLCISYAGLFATLVANSLSGAPNMHYFMSFIPVMIVPTAWFANSVQGYFSKNVCNSFASTAVAAALAFVLAMQSISVLRDNIITNLQDGTFTNGIPTYQNSNCYVISDYVQENSLEDDTVLLFGDGFACKRIADILLK